MATHIAAIFPAKGGSFELQTRPTPKPGPGELLVEVKSVALNPADVLVRDQGVLVSNYPTVVGFDIAGLVVEIGEDVPAEIFHPGITRVAAYSAFFWHSCHPDYGAFQEKCLVPWQHAVSLPNNNDNISWNEAATLPVSVAVPLNAWDIMGVPSRTGGEKGPEEVLLVWGASSSVGSMGVQSARVLRDRPSSPFAAVYAVAGAANHAYVSWLGADRVFDYKDRQVVENIVAAAREDGLVVRHCFLAIGQLALAQAVLGEFVGEGNKAMIASAPVIPPDVEVVSGVETVFVMPSFDEKERLAQFHSWMGLWLRENLGKGIVKPSPEVKVVGKGLGAINAALDFLRGGVSCCKLVVEVAE
ncbi:GroES-like protein [Poronia punctata]|nr:GroES-like protein [Poronia punctata]